MDYGVIYVCVIYVYLANRNATVISVNICSIDVFDSYCVVLIVFCEV